MKKTTIQCPVCGRNDVLPVDSSSIPVVLTCPDCHGSFLSFQEKTFSLDQNKLQKLFEEGSIAKLNEYFWDIIQDVEHKGVKVTFGNRPERDYEIGNEEISDLKITLGLCRSVDEFIKSL